MRKNGLPDARKTMVRQPKFRGCLLHDFGQPRIVDVRNLRKKMVYRVVVEAAKKMGDKPIFGCKIGCRDELVCRPTVVDFPLKIGFGKHRVLADVRRNEH